jgi:ribosomal protein S18 acetylase RimI-like enzyme
MQISELSSDDLDSYFSLVSEDYDTKENFRRLGFPLSKDEYEEKISHFSTWVKTFIAKIDTEVIGAITFTGAENLSMNDACIIADVRVKKSFRQQGLGSELVKSMLEFAKKHGIKRVVTTVSEMDVAGAKLFHKFGFKAYTVLKDYYIQGENAIGLELHLE